VVRQHRFFTSFKCQYSGELFLSEEEKKKVNYYYGGKEKKAGEIKKAEQPEEEMIPYFSRDFQRDFNRMMDRFQREFEGFWGQPPRAHYERFMRPFKTMLPSVDVEDRGKDFRLTVDLPGFDKENVDVEVTEDTVTVQAKQTQASEQKQKNYVRHERAYQTYYRKIPLPETIISDQAKANLDNGILEITLPKKAPKETKKLQNDSHPYFLSKTFNRLLFKNMLICFASIAPTPLRFQQ
jgi:HSP20 family protein